MLNTGCVVAAVFLICMAIRSKHQPIAADPSRTHALIAAVCAITLSVLIFQQTLGNPFQFDAFTHLFEVRNATLPQMFARFTRENLFFRPIGFLAYWTDARWAGSNLLRWHLGNIVLHALNGLAVYLLLLCLEFRSLAAALGAALFLTSGLTAETVAWIDIPFDLLAALFVLLAMLELLRWTRSGSRVPLILCALFALLACFTKESAFCAPLLAGALSATRAGAQRKRAFTGALLIALCCSAAFAYRWRTLQGICGYGGLSGVHFLPVFELLAFRMWGILQFPINWSSPVPASLRLAWWTCMAALLYICARARPRRGILFAGIGWAAAAILPAFAVAMISSDLAGARVYIWHPRAPPLL